VELEPLQGATTKANTEIVIERSASMPPIQHGACQAPCHGTHSRHEGVPRGAGRGRGIRTAESDVERATSACEYDTPEEPERLPRFVIGSFITGLVMITGGLLAMFFFG